MPNIRLGPHSDEVCAQSLLLASIALSISGVESDTSLNERSASGLHVLAVASEVLRSSQLGRLYWPGDFLAASRCLTFICRWYHGRHARNIVVPGMEILAFKQALLFTSGLFSTASCNFWRGFNPLCPPQAPQSYPCSMWVIDHGRSDANDQLRIIQITIQRHCLQ